MFEALLIVIAAAAIGYGIGYYGTLAYTTLSEAVKTIWRQKG
jgi:hypothetical protein